jgi:hypothetical protein
MNPSSAINSRAGLIASSLPPIFLIAKRRYWSRRIYNKLTYQVLVCFQKDRSPNLITFLLIRIAPHLRLLKDPACP